MKKIASIILLVVILVMSIVNASAYGPIAPANNHLYYIQNVRSGKYLTVNGNNIEQSGLEYNENQRFFVRQSKTASGITYYHFVPDCNNAYCIDVNNAVDANGSNIKIYSNSTTVPAAQNFRLISNGNYMYQVMPEISSTRVWDVANASLNNGANVALYTKRNLNDSYVGAQQWKFYTVEKSIMNQNLVDSTKHLDYSCSSDFSSYAASAANVWNSYRSGVIRKYITLIRSKDVEIIGVASLDNNAAAITKYDTKQILVNLSVWNGYTDSQKINLLAHELGHALGMGHLDDSANILYYAVNSTTVLKTNNKSSYDTAYAGY